MASALAIAGILASVKMYGDQRASMQRIEELQNRVVGCEMLAADIVKQNQEQWRELDAIKRDE